MKGHIINLTTFDMTEEQLQTIDKIYEMLQEAGLGHLEVGSPIPPRKPR